MPALTYPARNVCPLEHLATGGGDSRQRAAVDALRQSQGPPATRALAPPAAGVRVGPDRVGTCGTRFHDLGRRGGARPQNGRAPVDGSLLLLNCWPAGGRREGAG